MGVVLLVGHRGSGKTYLLDHLPDSCRCDGVTSLTSVPKEANIVLSTDTSRIKNIIDFTYFLVGEGKHVYIHTVPCKVAKLMVIFEQEWSE